MRFPAVSEDVNIVQLLRKANIMFNPKQCARIGIRGGTDAMYVAPEETLPSIFFIGYKIHAILS